MDLILGGEILMMMTMTMMTLTMMPMTTMTMTPMVAKLTGGRREKLVWETNQLASHRCQSSS